MEGTPDGSASSAPLYDRQHHPYQSLATPLYTLLPQNAGRDGTYVPGMRNNTYSQHPYPSALSRMMPQSTTAAPPPQPIDPAPATVGSQAPGVLRPMHVRGVMPQPAINSLYGQGPLMPRASTMPDSNPPTHVVGSQDRRGILPSIPGTPAALTVGMTQAKNQTFQKNTDGRFPCPECTKTYGFEKHLKRHLLNHSGERPYTCILCYYNFTRSDILKRHFAKCAERHGNPTGASHLSHPQARTKKNAAARQNPAGVEGDVNHMQWIASPSCQNKDADSYPGWPAFDSDSMSRDSGARFVGPL
ncbi:hypothetical protein N656DRAFT_800427 [Canariomyces notabilis]|uniref:C2H2-type domain-containing protein n=1 Tax=Canariomyces notabilis TaxID=2074819 RepID=A0AAN6QPM7_9PEZI|nr:hypothetical protein N656DRAFT_800427 [Canariomyces arenarius]